jgi:hypothetical protein
MKREPKCKLNPKPVYPLFRKRFCEKCKMNFVREPGWKYQKIHFCGYGVSSTNEYLCKDCAPTQKEAYRFFKPTRPSPPQGNSKPI